MVPGSGARGTHHKLEKLFTEGVFLNVVLTSSTILSHEVLKGQHHAVQKFIEHSRQGCSGRTPQPTNLDGPSCRTSLLNTPEPEPHTREEVLVHNSVQRPLRRIVLNGVSELKGRENGERMWGQNQSLVHELEEREIRCPNR
jgi:hypothetical protein